MCQPGPGSMGPNCVGKRVEDEQRGRRMRKRDNCRIVGPQKICTRNEIEERDCNVVGNLQHCNGKRGDYETIETKRFCKTGSAHNTCGREITKREHCGVEKRDCHVVGGQEHCNRKRLVCKREEVEKKMCQPGPGSMGPNCVGKRVEDEDHYIIETKRFCKVGSAHNTCGREITKRQHCKREEVEKKMCQPGPGKPYCGKRVVCTRIE